MIKSLKGDNNMRYETFDPKIHDVNKIATLQYNVDFRTYDKLFNSKERAIERIGKTLKKDESIKVIYDNDTIIGLIITCTYDRKPKSRFNSLRLLLVSILDHFVICEIEKDDFYIAEIAIDEKQRSEGYGTKVIKNVISCAKKNGYKRVILDVDFRNRRSKALYEKLGFKVYDTKIFMKRGMYNMEYKIS